jgi:hypothetical protein
LLIGAVDSVSVIAALSASSTEARQRVCLFNAATDLAMASVLIAVACRRRASARLVNAIAAASVIAGAAAWSARARRLRP